MRQHCIASHCIALHRIASHCIASHRIASHRIASHRIASHRIPLHCIARLLAKVPQCAPIGLTPILPCLHLNQEVFPSHVASIKLKGASECLKSWRGQTPILWVFYPLLLKFHGDQLPRPYIFRRPCTELKQGKPSQANQGWAG
jgi:hypothetical protein